MKLTETALLCGLLISLVGGLAFAQDKEPESINPVNEYSQLVVSVDLEGDPQIGAVNSIGIRDLSEFEALLRTESVQAELELTNEQRGKLKKLLDDAHKAKLAIRDQAWKGGKEEAKKVLGIEFAKHSNQFSDATADLLLPHQEKLLRQINERLRFRSIGPVRYFQSLEEEDELKLAPAEKVKLREFLENAALEISGKAQKTMVKQIDRLVEPLNEEQIKAVENYVEQAKKRVLYFDLFQSQLNEKDSQEWTEENRDWVMNCVIVYMLQPDGALIHQGRTSLLRQSKDLEQLIPYFQWMESLQNGSWGKALELTKSQQDQLSAIRQKLTDADVMISNFMANSNNPFFDAENAKDMQVAHRRKAYSDIVTLLNEKQQQRSKALYFDTAVNRFGLFSELIKGQLGKALKITAAQKAELKKIAGEIRSEMKDESIRIEEEYFDDILKCLSTKNRKLIQAKIGKGLEKIGANITQLVIGLKE